MTCIGCKHEHQEKFCPMCGEEAATPKITFGSLSSNLLSTFISMERGFLYNVKALFIHPKKFVEAYIHGKRKGVHSPIAFLVLSITLYLFADYFLSSPAVKDIDRTDEGYSIGFEIGQFIRFNLKYIWISLILWLGIASKIVFGRYNLAEHFVIAAFIIGQSTLIGLLALVIVQIHMPINPIVYLFIVWMIFRIYKQHKITSILKSIAVFVLFSIQLLVVIILIAICLNLMNIS